MIYAYFTDLNLDKEAFEGYKKKQMAMFGNMASEPEGYFMQEFLRFTGQNNPRYTDIYPTDATWTQTDYELAYNKYKERFANAGDFEFFFVGNIDDKVIEDFSAKYLASLPSTGEKEKIVDLGIRSLKGEHKKVYYKGTEPKSKVLIRYRGEAKYNGKEKLALEALGEILTIKLTEQLRENESGVYGVNASGAMEKVPYGSFRFTISFPCGPDNAEKLTASALNELQKIIANGPEEKDLSKFKEGELLDYKKNIKENRMWLSVLSQSYTEGENAEEILAYEQKIAGLTAKDIQAVAKKYLSGDKVIGMLMPEKS